MKKRTFTLIAAALSGCTTAQVNPALPCTMIPNGYCSYTNRSRPMSDGLYALTQHVERLQYELAEARATRKLQERITELEAELAKVRAADDTRYATADDRGTLRDPSPKELSPR